MFTTVASHKDRALSDGFHTTLEADPERLERMEEEAEYRSLYTPAMSAAARASDERAAFITTDEDDAADFWQRASGHEDITVSCHLHD